MAEMNGATRSQRQFKARHRGRGAQVWIYLGKMLRMFVYQNDWKVLPMAALIAGLVGMVIRNRLFLNMEGSLMGGFAMVMVCIWNGCFNSIQVICRERDVIKREHRSGMHISSYIFSHMVYQALLCLLQTGVTLYVTQLVGVRYDLGKPLFTPIFIMDYGISMFLITFASDMMSLWISTLAHTTTTAMTIMPFVLIFQLVFSGGMLTLPAWSEPLTNFTISNPGLKVMAAQADYNNQPLVSIWNTISGMRNSEVEKTFTVGQVLDVLSDGEISMVQDIRSKELDARFTLNQLRGVLAGMADAGDTVTIPGENGDQEVEISQLLEALDESGLLEDYGDVEIGGNATVGEVVDELSKIDSLKEKAITVNTTVGDVIDLLDKENPGGVREAIESKAAEASYKADYDNTEDNIVSYWMRLVLFILAFAALSVITLEFIDKDKR